MKRAYSAYARAINYLSQGNESKARLEFKNIESAWKAYGIEVDIDKSIEKMKAEIHRLWQSGIIDSKPLPQKKVRTISYLDDDYAVSRDKIVKRKKTSTSKKSYLPSRDVTNPSGSFKFDKDKQLPGSAISLMNLTDTEIFDGAMELPCQNIEKNLIKINYNNVAYGGYAPNLLLDFSSDLSMIHNSGKRLKAIQDFLSENNIVIDNISHLTPIALIQSIAKVVDSYDIDIHEKEKILENITLRITQLILNENDVSNDYLLETDTRIHGRHYGHVGIAGGLINSLFSNVSFQNSAQDQGTISTNLLIKAGTADCRATNATLAALLNIGYKEISSEKQAKILYTKMAHGVNPTNFSKCPPEDHNIVLVKDSKGEIVVRDAYFQHVDNTPLREAIAGKIGKGTLQPNENKTSAPRNWAFQIPGAPPYPSQQQLKEKNKMQLE